MTCFECTTSGENLDPHQLIAAISLSQLEWNEENWYEYQCPQGHVSNFRVQLLRFQILFEMGLQALVKSYLREAVLSMYSALEDLSRFYCLVHAESAGLSSVKIKRLKKALTNSERRAGAFQLALTLRESDLSDRFGTKGDEWRKLRNKVIHEGTFPTRSQAQSFCEEIYNFMSGVTRELVREHPTIVERYVLSNLTERQGDSAYAPFATAAPGSAVRLEAHSEDQAMRFDKILEQATNWNESQEVLHALSKFARTLSVNQDEGGV